MILTIISKSGVGIQVDMHRVVRNQTLTSLASAPYKGLSFLWVEYPTPCIEELVKFLYGHDLAPSSKTLEMIYQSYIIVKDYTPSLADLRSYKPGLCQETDDLVENMGKIPPGRRMVEALMLLSSDPSRIPQALATNTLEPIRHLDPSDVPSRNRAWLGYLLHAAPPQPESEVYGLFYLMAKELGIPELKSQAMTRIEETLPAWDATCNRGRAVQYLASIYEDRTPELRKAAQRWLLTCPWAFKQMMTKDEFSEKLCTDQDLVVSLIEAMKGVLSQEMRNLLNDE